MHDVLFLIWLITSEMLHKNGKKIIAEVAKNAEVFFTRFLIFFFLGELCVNIDLPLCSGSSALGILSINHEHNGLNINNFTNFLIARLNDRIYETVHYYFLFYSPHPPLTIISVPVT